MIWVPGAITAESPKAASGKAVFRSLMRLGLSFNWLLLDIRFMPASKKGASVTVCPTIGIRYSKFATMLVSPPGNTIWYDGIVWVEFTRLTAPVVGSINFCCRGVPSVLSTFTGAEFGTNAHGPA